MESPAHLTSAVPNPRPESVQHPLEAVVDALPDGFVLTDGDGQIVLVNSELERLFGYRRDELIGQSVDVLLPESVRAGHQLHRSAFALSPTTRPMGIGFDLVGRHRDGTELPVEIALSPTTLAGSLHVMATVRDVSVQRCAAAEMQRREELYRATFEQAPVAMAMTAIDDPERRLILRANSALGRLLGYSPEQLEGMAFSELTDPEDRAEDSELASRLIGHSMATPVVREKRYLRSDGTAIWCELHAIVIADEHGEYTRTLAHIIDITDRKTAQRVRDHQLVLWETLSELTTDLFADGDTNEADIVARYALAIAGGIGAALVERSPDGVLSIRGRAGQFQTASALPRSLAERISESMEGGSLTVQDVQFNDMQEALDTDACLIEAASEQVRATCCFCCVPLESDVRQRAIVVVRCDRRCFEADEAENLSRYARHAQLALELSKQRADDRRLAVLDDRERIARDLHDRVIGRLFATGLALQGLASRSLDERVRQDADHAIEEIDHSITDLRRTIFTLTHGDDERIPIADVHRLLIRTVEEKRQLLGIDPEVVTSGPSVIVARHAVDELMSALSEALVNVARHAHATHVVVNLETTRDCVTLIVQDNGRGLDPARAAGNGLTSLMSRASRLGGTCELSGSDPGTTLSWSFPLR
jgi:PAS domain S-box-containing protein